MKPVSARSPLFSSVAEPKSSPPSSMAPLLLRSMVAELDPETGRALSIERFSHDFEPVAPAAPVAPVPPPPLAS